MKPSRSQLRKLPLHPFRSAYFTREEEWMVARAVVIAMMVWTVVVMLDESVHWTFDQLVAFVEVSEMPPLVLLIIGISALGVTVLSTYGTRRLLYRDDQGQLRALVDVELSGSIYLIPSLFVLVLTVIFTHSTTIYCTQRMAIEQREVLPGYRVSRLVIPGSWQGKTLHDLRIRSRFGITVLGILDAIRPFPDSRQPMALNPSVEEPLAAGDILLLLEKNEVQQHFRLPAYAEDQKAVPPQGVSLAGIPEP